MEFLVASARQAGIRPEDYGLSSDPRRMHSLISRVHLPRGYREFLEDLLSKGSVRVRILAEVLGGLSKD